MRAIASLCYGVNELVVVDSTEQITTVAWNRALSDTPVGFIPCIHTGYFTASKISVAVVTVWRPAQSRYVICVKQMLLISIATREIGCQWIFLRQALAWIVVYELSIVAT